MSAANNKIKVQVIKQIQDAGSAGIILPEIKVDGASRGEIKTIVDGLEESGLVRFSGLRDTYHWNGSRKNDEGQETKQVRQRRTGHETVAEQILACLETHPGATLQKIMDVTGRPKGSVSVYLSDLVHAGKAASRRDTGHRPGTRKLYYLPGDAPAENTEADKPTTRERILDCLCRMDPLHKGMTRKEISEALNAHENTVGHQLAKLQEPSPQYPKGRIIAHQDLHATRNQKLYFLAEHAPEDLNIPSFVNRDDEKQQIQADASSIEATPEGRDDHDHPPAPAADVEQDPVDDAETADAAEMAHPPVRIHVRSTRKRLADVDGISAKAAIDGLIHAGILRADSPEHVVEVTYSQVRGEPEKTEIIITPEMT